MHIFYLSLSGRSCFLIPRPLSMLICAQHYALPSSNPTEQSRSETGRYSLPSHLSLWALCALGSVPCTQPLLDNNRKLTFVPAASSDCVSTPGSLHMPFLQWQVLFLCLLLVPFLPLCQDTLADHIRPCPSTALSYPVLITCISL